MTKDVWVGSFFILGDLGLSLCRGDFSAEA